ncbi:MAG: hypothetical protein ACK5TN_18405 [Acidobacteriota bacterium]
MTEERHPSQDWNEEERGEPEVVEEQSEGDVRDDRAEEPDSRDEEASEESFFDRVRARFAAPASRDSKSTERTRGLVVLVGASVACLILFVGMFTTDADSTKKSRGTGPNLGRPATETTNQENGNRSPVPQLNVNQQPNEESNELTEQDLLGTMRNRVPPQQTAPGPVKDLSTVDFSDAPTPDPALADAYRRQNRTVPPPAPATTNWEAAIADYQNRQPKSTNMQPPPVPAVKEVPQLGKSSIIFVRSQTANVSSPARVSPTVARVSGRSLPQGMALVARLQHGVSSAAKAPVIAVIEYNYEEAGEILVPAGTKAYGELTGATPQGWVTLKFHSLEFPSGETEEISASALGMQRQALRGEVSGLNQGKRFLTRALTGVGTIAAFAVGGRGLSGGIDNSVLLRERIAANVALAGEQELARLAYQQNIVVAVPANTRFYLVLQERSEVQSGRLAQTEPTSSPGSPSVSTISEPELRELIQIREEMRAANRLLRSTESPISAKP